MIIIEQNSVFNIKITRADGVKTTRPIAGITQSEDGIRFVDVQDKQLEKIPADEVDRVIDYEGNETIIGGDADLLFNTINDTFFFKIRPNLSNQILTVSLDSSYYDFNFSGYGTARTGEYQFQTTGVNISNAPFQLNPSAIYDVRVKINNNDWHSVEVDFSTQGDFDNINRKFYRSGQTFVAAQSIGWNERILQPQYEKLSSLDILNNNPRPGQTTEGLINNTTVFETYIDQSFTPRRSGNFTCLMDISHSLDVGTQDFIANLQIFDGPSLVGGLPTEYRKEPKDTGGPGEDLNVLSGGAIIGTANTSTNQRDGAHRSFDVDLVAGVTYNLLLTWAGSTANDLAAIYGGYTSIKENLIS